jgi:FMN phosphatase YigB (HAD superfamily)
MTLTLLLDLDDTLLGNSMDVFIPAYLQALAKHMTALHVGDGFIQILLNATRRMTENDRPDRTLKETFDRNFYPALGLDYEQTHAFIEIFYRETFPKLKAMTDFRPEAVNLVETALRRGYRVVIATNPLFPLVAVQKRVAWAGLEPYQEAVSLVTSYETFHYTKPRTAFYAEILARLGWPEGPVVMVGNDVQDDIAPAQTLGLATFLVGEGLSPSGDNRHGAGSLKDVLPWLDATPEEALLPSFGQADALKGMLRSTPACLDTVSRDLPAQAWRARPAPAEWALNEICCHLRDVDAEVYLPRLQQILTEERPFIRAVDTDSWAAQRDYHRQDGPQALRDFIAGRVGILAWLDRLEEQFWMRPARHTLFGPTNFLETVGFMGAHDRLHVQQVLNTLSNLESAVEI